MDTREHIKLANDTIKVYCPLLEKQIEDADCYEIVNCGLGYIKKRLHPEIKNWDEVVSVCAKLFHEMDFFVILYQKYISMLH